MSIAVPPTSELTVTREADGTVLVRLAGSWRLGSGLPSLDEVERALAEGQTAHIAFDTRELGEWDSSVLTFLASVSHELRTPLTRMRLASELQEHGDRPDLRERIGRDIETLDELIGELLLASRLDAGVGSEARESVDLLALAAEEAARFDAEVSGEPAIVRGEPRLLRHLVKNLLQNARRHGGEGEVSVAVDRDERGAARLRVGDRGPGIPAEEREAVFEPFYQPAGPTGSGVGGVGLGLALVRRIARLHGGDARCLPRDGGGACFEVTLGESA